MTTQLTTYVPDILQAIDLCPRLAASTRHQYRKALAGYLDTGNSLADPGALADYARDLPTSSKAFLKAAVRLVTEQTAVALKGQATPENVESVTAALYRLEALQSAIEVKTAKGQKAGTWLSQAQVKTLLDTCAGDLRGQRDRLVLGLLAASGLRRQEATNLRFEDVKLQPVKNKLRTVLQVTGKGAKTRVVPISDNLANAIDQWSSVVGGDGFILRSINQTGAINGKLSASAVFEIVRSHGASIGLPGLAPHDLRRTFAQLGFEAGIPITQISVLLGHSSVSTTQRYLNLDLDLSVTASDFVPF
jgi:integrase